MSRKSEAVSRPNIRSRGSTGPAQTQAHRGRARKWQHVGALVVVAAVVAACRDALPPTAPDVSQVPQSLSQLPPAGSAVRGYEPVTAEERDDARLIARTLAASLRDQAVAHYVKASLARSAAHEQKLHFASYLSGRGGSLLGGMLRKGNLTTTQLGNALRGVRDLEFYMPVAAHRDHWTGSKPPLVAIALNEEETPEAYDADGNRHMLNRIFPPADPVLVLAPVETDLRAQIALNLHGQAERVCSPTADETLNAAAAACGATSLGNPRALHLDQVPADVTGLYVTAIDLARDECGGECWAWGDPEYQIYTFGKSASSGSQMIVAQCSGDNADSPYHWDMNGRSWAGMGLLLTRDQMNGILQADAGWMHMMWEDDAGGCTLQPHVNPWGAAVQVVGAVQVAWVALAAHEGGVVVAAVLAAANGIQTLVMGGDDYVGTLVQEDASQFGDGMGSGHNMVIQRGTENGQLFVGRATIKPYTTSGVYIGPTASVTLSHPTSTKFPLGSGLQLYSYPLDAYGTFVPMRPQSWSSSNSAVASVDGYGFVTGHQEGSATITVTIDGYSASAVVYPTAIGAPVEVRLEPPVSVTLQPGQYTYVYAHIYDSNGFEVPTGGNYEWSSADPSACQVGYGSFDGEAYLVSNGGIGAQITVTTSEGLSQSLYCSSNGDEAKIPVDGATMQPARTTKPHSVPHATPTGTVRRGRR